MSSPEERTTSDEDAWVHRALPEEAGAPHGPALPEEVVQSLIRECERMGVAADRLSLALEVCLELLHAPCTDKGHQGSNQCKTCVQVFGANPNGQRMNISERLRTSLADGTALGPCIYKPIYDALSPALKQCYLTFAAYPKGERVPGEELVQLWAVLAEVPIPGCKVAERYLADLVARCLVHRDEKRYHMHDILRSLAVLEAGEPGMRCHYDVDNVRRLCLDL